MLAVTIILLLAQSPERIYENIEVSSYVTSVKKTSTEKTEQKKRSQKAQSLNLEKTTNEAVAKASADPETSQDSGAGESLASESEITSPAVLLNKVKAHRTEAARQADFSGVAQVELIVGADGLVKNIKLRNSLPYGLDEVAIEVVRQSKFKPAMVDFKPVASAILFKVRFESER